MATCSYTQSNQILIYKADIMHYVEITEERITQLLTIYQKDGYRYNGLLQLVKADTTKREIWALVERGYIKPNNLLDVNMDAKTKTSTKKGILIGIQYMMPERNSDVVNTCSHASKGCALACLNTSGQGGIGINKKTGLNVQQASRLIRTAFFYTQREQYHAMLQNEIDKLARKAERENLIPAVRLNGTSDIAWEYVRVGKTKQNIMMLNDDIQFYDYSKIPVTSRKLALELPNYHLTFSRSGENDAHMFEAIANGLNVTVVVDIPANRKDIPVPATIDLGDGVQRETIDGDIDNSDARFLDARNKLVVLRIKDSKGGNTERVGFGLGAGYKALRATQDIDSGFVIKV